MYGSHKKHSAGARNIKARAKRALLLPSTHMKRTENINSIDVPTNFYQETQQRKTKLSKI